MANGIRIYAGYPVRRWDAYRVGMVCVYGLTSRSTRPRDPYGWRVIAVLVEEILRQDAPQLVQPV